MIMDRGRRISKRVTVKVIVGLILISFFSLAVPVERGKAEDQQVLKSQILSEQISEYYNKWNFVASFSTSQEQFILSRYIEQQKTPPDELTENKRIKKIYELIMELRKYELQGIDPDFVYPKEPKFGKVIGCRIVGIYETKRTDGKISVSAVAYPLKPEAIKILISQYEQDNFQKIPSFKKNPELFTLPKTLPRKEIHTWRFVEGKWMKEKITYLLLEK